MTQKSLRSPAPRSPTQVDTHIGGRVRLARKLRDRSQDQLAQALGMTFQQVQKYERGFNRMSASRLWEAARYLEVPITYFYEGLHDGPPQSIEEAAVAMTEELEREAVLTPPVARVLRAASRVQDVQVLTSAAQLLEAVAHGQSAQGSRVTKAA